MTTERWSKILRAVKHVERETHRVVHGVSPLLQIPGPKPCGPLLPIYIVLLVGSTDLEGKKAGIV
jgi:hypothetical protein